MEIGIACAQAQLDELIERAVNGEHVVISSAAGSVKLLPTSKPSSRPSRPSGVEDLWGVLKGKIHYTEGWDTPLSNQEAQNFFGCQRSEEEPPEGSDRRSCP